VSPSREDAHVILVVDDDPGLLRALKSVLSQRGYRVVLAASGEEALELAASADPDLVILDLALPGISGLEVCRSLREWLKAPILVLTVRDRDTDKIAALDLGADDYLTKPFSSGELLARIRALLRRAGSRPSRVSVARSGDLVIDLDARRVTKQDQALRLTRTEFAVLAVLAASADRVVTAGMLMKAVWGSDGAEDTQALRVHISKLRSKIEDDPTSPRYIVTEPGIGYRFVVRGRD